MSNHGNAVRSKLWAKAKGWNPDQITWLLLGFDPLLVADDPPPVQEDERRVSKEVLDVLSLAFDGTSASRRLAPIEAIKLFTEVGMHFPDELVQAVREEIEDSPAIGTSESATANQLKTARKIILAIATTKFGYQPDQHNPAASRIEAEVRRVGLSVTDDTVRELLKRAYSELDQEQKKALKQVATRD